MSLTHTVLRVCYLPDGGATPVGRLYFPGQRIDWGSASSHLTPANAAQALMQLLSAGVVI